MSAVGTLKEVGQVYQQTVIDTYSKLGFAKLCDEKTSITAADTLNDHERKPIARLHQQGHGASPVLDCDRSDLQHQSATVDIDQGVVLAALDLFAGIETAETPRLGRLDYPWPQRAGRYSPRYVHDPA